MKTHRRGRSSDRTTIADAALRSRKRNVQRQRSRPRRRDSKMPLSGPSSGLEPSDHYRRLRVHHKRGMRRGGPSRTEQNGRLCQRRRQSPSPGKVRAHTEGFNRRLRLPATEVLWQSLGNPRPHPVVRVVEVADGVPGADELIEAGAVLIGESHLEHVKGVVELFHGARTDDRRGDGGLVLAPEKRKLALRQTTRLRQRRERAGYLDAAP